jgi:hypothetical protein
MKQRRRRIGGLQPGYTKEDLERVRAALGGENGITLEEVEGPEIDAALIRAGEQWRREQEAHANAASLDQESTADQEGAPVPAGTAASAPAR